MGLRFTREFIGKTNRSIFLDAANSTYELLFLNMFGFKKGLYSNDVAWFFSALLIVTFVLGPLIAKYKSNFSLYFAPLIALFSYGMLSLNYDYLHDPMQTIPNTFLLKGLIRAFAGICIGSFLYGVIQSNVLNSFMQKSKKNLRRLICLIDFLLWTIIIFYMVYPFKSNAGKLSIQYDYIIVIFMTAALLPVLGNMWSNNYKQQLVEKIANKLGRYAYFAFFGQAIFYSVDKVIYSLNIGILFKALVLNISVAVISIALGILTHKISFAKK